MNYEISFVAFFQNDRNNLLWEYHFGHDVKQIEISKDGRFVIVSTSSTAYLFENNIVHQGSVTDAGYNSISVDLEP